MESGGAKLGAGGAGVGAVSGWAATHGASHHSMGSERAFIWTCNRSRSGYEHSTSELTTKKGASPAPLSTRWSSAILSEPAVPKPSVSWQIVILSSSSFSPCSSASVSVDGIFFRSLMQKMTSVTPAYAPEHVSEGIAQRTRAHEGCMRQQG